MDSLGLIEVTGFAATLFVLDRLLAAKARPGRYLMSALGPGFTASFALLETS